MSEPAAEVVGNPPGPARRISAAADIGGADPLVPGFPGPKTRHSPGAGRM
ncbi:hypothetical protein ACFC6L_28465 [Kitasatospora phosalacinea]